MKQHEIDRILTSQNYGVDETKGVQGILARLYRQVLMDLNVNPNRFQILLTEAALNAKRSVKNGNVSKYFTVGNLRRELEKPAMTFKVFMKGIKLLKVSKLKISIELTHASGKRSLHETSVDLGNADISQSIFDEDIASGYDSNKEQD